MHQSGFGFLCSFACFYFEKKAKLARDLGEKPDTYPTLVVFISSLEIQTLATVTILSLHFQNAKFVVEKMEILFPQEWTVLGQEAISTS